jgi:hypothetical protein
MKIAAALFFIIGVIAAFALVAESNNRKSTTRNSQTRHPDVSGVIYVSETSITEGDGLTSVAFGIISATCFLSSAFLYSRKSE